MADTPSSRLACSYNRGVPVHLNPDLIPGSKRRSRFILARSRIAFPRSRITFPRSRIHLQDPKLFLETRQVKCDFLHFRSGASSTLFSLGQPKPPNPATRPTALPLLSSRKQNNRSHSQGSNHPLGGSEVKFKSS